MFIPNQYREPDSSWKADLIRRNPLALLVTNSSEADVPDATHLPVIPQPGMTGSWPVDLSGVTLWGHMNRMNPHWTALTTGTRALLTFMGPHAYVSPTIYQMTPAAPTWNFTAVHVHGVLHKIESAEGTLEVVRATVRAFEADFGARWDMTDSLDYFRELLPGVGAFRMTVTRADGMFKLSQEQPPEVRERVRQALTRQESSRQRDTADLMDRLP